MKIDTNTAKQIRESRLTAKRQPNRAELEKALEMCLDCLATIKKFTNDDRAKGYIETTITAANAVITRD